jgi:hypothetical protein
VTTIQNVRQLAKARGYRISKVRSPWVEDQCLILTYVEAADTWTPLSNDSYTLEEAEAWLRKQPTLERGR